MVILKDGEEHTFCEKMTDKELALMHNVAGEIKGSEAAMQYAVDHNIPEITIYHDYEALPNGAPVPGKLPNPEQLRISLLPGSREESKSPFCKSKRTLQTTNTTIWLTSLPKSSRNPVADPGAFVICAPHIFCLNLVTAASTANINHL